MRRFFWSLLALVILGSFTLVQSQRTSVDKKQQQLQKLMSPHFSIEQMRDSFFYSSTVGEPARARFLVMRNDK